MLGYHFLTYNAKELIFIPFLLAGRESNDKMVYNYDPDTLEHLTLSLKDGWITKEYLESRGWEITEVDIPYHYTKEVRRLCFKRASKEKIDRISDQVKEEAEEDQEANLYEDDYEDNWWTRGEEPPFYRI